MPHGNSPIEHEIHPHRHEHQIRPLKDIKLGISLPPSSATTCVPRLHRKVCIPKIMSELARTLPASWYCNAPLYQMERRAVFMKVRDFLDAKSMKLNNSIVLVLAWPCDQVPEDWRACRLWDCTAAYLCDPYWRRCFEPNCRWAEGVLRKDSKISSSQPLLWLIVDPG